MRKLLQVLLIAILCLGVVSIPSCSKRTEPNVVTDFRLSAHQVKMFMVVTNDIYPVLAGIQVDSAYVLPTLDWVKGSFSQAFASFKFQLNNNQWKSEENDCDDFARFGAFFAQYLHHNTPNKIKNTSLCFGEFGYQKKDLSGHAINVFLYREKGKVNVGFYEPQTCEVITLTKEEVSTCQFYRF